MYVDQARDHLRHSVAAVQRDELDNFHLDDAIITACQEFLKLTKIVTGRTVVATVDGEIEIDFDAAITGFLPIDLCSVRHDSANNYKPVEMIDFESMRTLHESSTEEGLPRKIAFETSALAWIYPIPDAAYNMTIVHTKPLKLLDDAGAEFEWTAGITKKGRINIPDRYMKLIVQYGAAAHLVSPEKKNAAWVSFRASQFQDWMRSVMGDGLKNRVKIKNPSDYR